MELKETVTARGIFHLEIIDPDGNLVETIHQNNLIVASGRENLARLIGSEQTNRHISKFGIGTNGSVAADGDTALTGAFVKNISGVSYPTATTAVFTWTLAGNEANGMAIREFGLITASDVLFARTVREVVTKQEGFVFNGTWTIIF